MIATEEQTLKLQLDQDGRVWRAYGIETPVVCDDLLVYLDDLRARQGLHIRVLGCKQNASLIVDLYQRYCSPRKDGLLEVATPAVCMDATELMDPSVALYRMRQCTRAPSLGGWHRVNDLDYPTYAIAAQYQKDGQFTEHIRRLFEIHPVQKSLSFISSLEQSAATALMSEIIDPRWFIDMRAPERLSRLKNYLGLSPRYISDVVRDKVKSDRARRCQLAVFAWGWQKETPDDMDAPGAFLWRRYMAAGGGEKGLLRATQAFISFLARAWQGRLVSRSAQADVGDLFTPDAILKGSEVTAYKRHLVK